MRFRLVPVVLLALSAAACGTSSSGEPGPTMLMTTTDSVPPSIPASSNKATPSLRDAVQQYSDDYLTGKGEAAFALLSKTCQVQFGRSSFLQVVAAAKQQFGSALPLASFSSKSVDAAHALVTYTYLVASINQKDQRWTLESGGWKYDAC